MSSSGIVRPTPAPGPECDAPESTAKRKYQHRSMLLGEVGSPGGDVDMSDDYAVGIDLGDGGDGNDSASSTGPAQSSADVSIIISGAHEGAAPLHGSAQRGMGKKEPAGHHNIDRSLQPVATAPPRPVSSGGESLEEPGLKHSALGTGTLTRAGAGVAAAPSASEGTTDAALSSGTTPTFVTKPGPASDAPSPGDNGNYSSQCEESLPHQQLQLQRAEQQVPPPQGREPVLRRLSETLVRGSLTMLNLSQRGLTSRDANTVKLALLQNPHLSVLQLGYNSLGDEGVSILASGIAREDGTHHPSLSVLDLGFNCVGDNGCSNLALRAVSGNQKLKTLYLSGNNVREQGAAALASAIVKGCGLTCLHLTANRIGAYGVRAIAAAIAEAEARSQVAENLGPGQSTALIGSTESLKSVKQLYLGGANMGSSGCLSIANMILSNQSLRVLSLSDNGINDQNMAFLSQSIARNRKVPLEVIQLSFNRITCVGVESLMNAVWGSETLHEIRLDNNRIRDRGAQLAAVVLTSIKLKLLDLGFNRITTVGIRALMKSISENNTLESLTLSGNPLDTNASKAVSYALAYNKSLREFYVDNCSVGYAAQRHIAAGIVSNPELSLKAITGFRLGSITVTLGLPPALEQWTNEQTLKFIRLMWERRRHCVDEEKRINVAKDPSQSIEDDDKTTNDSTSVDLQEQSRTKEQKSGPADPTTVVSAAKTAFAALGDAGGALLLSDSLPRERSDSSPLVPNDAIMLERTPSGNVRVPPTDKPCEADIMIGEASSSLVPSSPTLRAEGSVKPSSCPNVLLSEKYRIDPVRRKRLEEWLSEHFSSLNQLANLPFNDADLWQLHQYFFSPVGTAIFKKATDGPELGNFDSPTKSISAPATTATSQADSSPKQPSCGLVRKISYRCLNDAGAADTSTSNLSSSPTDLNSAGRRRSVSMLDADNDSECPSSQPAMKRARSNKPRIEFYPRIKTKLEALRSKTNQQQALIILRQLKYVEGVMFQGKNVLFRVSGDADQPSTSDVEAILDML